MVERLFYFLEIKVQSGSLVITLITADKNTFSFQAANLAPPHPPSCSVSKDGKVKARKSIAWPQLWFELSNLEVEHVDKKVSSRKHFNTFFVFKT